jgi:hypothetical protein
MNPAQRFEAGIEAVVRIAKAATETSVLDGLAAANSALPSGSDSPDALDDLDDLDFGNAASPACQLATRLGLSTHECHFVWMLAAHATDRRVADAARQQFGSAAQHGLSTQQFAAWRKLLPSEEHALHNMFSAEHPLRRFNVATPVFSDGHGGSLPWRINPSIIDFLRWHWPTDAVR